MAHSLHDAEGVATWGARAVVAGRSEFAGRPMAQLLLQSACSGERNVSVAMQDRPPDDLGTCSDLPGDVTMRVAPPISADDPVRPGGTARFPQARVAVIEGGMVPLMEQRPAEVAEVITEFLP